MPISRVRSVTLTSMIFMMTMPPTSREMLVTGTTTAEIAPNTWSMNERTESGVSVSKLSSLPGSVLKRLREWSRAPVLVLSVQEGDVDKVSALDNGADDYMTKPFSTAELLARLRVVQRRVLPEADQAVFHSGVLEVDLSSRLVTRKGQEVKLTPTEYSLLRLLVRNAGKVVTHRQILKEVWGPSYGEQTHYLRVYVAHLREKLEDDPARPELILTEPGVGYRLTAPH